MSLVCRDRLKYRDWCLGSECLASRRVLRPAANPEPFGGRSRVQNRSQPVSPRPDITADILQRSAWLQFSAKGRTRKSAVYSCEVTWDNLVGGLPEHAFDLLRHFAPLSRQVFELLFDIGVKGNSDALVTFHSLRAVLVRFGNHSPPRNRQNLNRWTKRFSSKGPVHKSRGNACISKGWKGPVRPIHRNKSAIGNDRWTQRAAQCECPLWVISCRARRPFTRPLSTQ